MDFWERLVSDGFMPHGHCYLWTPEILWLLVASDAAIVLAYYSIPAALFVFLSRRRDVVFPGIFVLFSTFIFACGTTHLMDIITTWKPWYLAEGIVKGLTGVVSLGTAIVLWPLIPKAVKIPSPRQLEEANAALREENAQRRKAEGELKGLASELEERVRLRTRELEIANDELERFADVASHDLQEPLRMMVSYAGLLEEEAGDRLDAEHLRYLERVRSGGMRMGFLLDEMLRYARVGGAVEEAQAARPAECLDAALENLAAAIDETGARIERDELPAVRCDPWALTQIFQNLIGNALRHSGVDAPRVRVSARRVGDSVELAVADEGGGFDMRHAEQIFEPFRKLDRDSSGSGMGLAITKRLVTTQGGSIRAESDPGRGATFVVTLPAAEAP